MIFLKAIAIYLVTFLVIDGLWINLAAIHIYQQDVGALMAESPRMLPALVFYIGYAAATIYLIVKPAKSIGSATLNGAILGALAYGTFAVSNYALLQAWTARLLIIDTAFGAVVTAACSAVTYKFSKGLHSGS